MHPVPAGRHPDPGGLRRGRPRRRPHVRGRGARSRGGPPWRAVRRPVRPAARPSAGRGGRHRPRSQVYIANVVKCRPPDNRDPRPDEIGACRPYLTSRSPWSAPAWSSPWATSPPGSCSTPTRASPSCGARRTRWGRPTLVPTFHPAAALRGGGVVLAQMRADFVRAKQLMGGRREPDPRAGHRLGRWPPGSWPRPLATVCVPGDVLLLSGDLGAGKTTFAQGFGRALGIDEPITSPTFTLVRQYEMTAGATGVRMLLHADVYRLDHLGEIADLGLGQLVEDGGVALVEWGDAAEPVLGDRGAVPAVGGRPRRRRAAAYHRDRRRAPPGTAAGTTWWPPSPRGRCRMKVLALETATDLVGAALSARRRGGRALPPGRPGPRRAPGPGHRGGVRPVGLHAGRPRRPGRRRRSRAVHRAAGRGGHGQGARARRSASACSAVAASTSWPPAPTRRLRELARPGWSPSSTPGGARSSPPPTRFGRRGRPRRTRPRRHAHRPGGGAVAPEDLVAWCDDLAAAGPVLVVGDGAVRYRELLAPRPGLDVGLAHELSPPRRRPRWPASPCVDWPPARSPGPDRRGARLPPPGGRQDQLGGACAAAHGPPRAGRAAGDGRVAVRRPSPRRGNVCRSWWRRCAPGT